MSENQRTAADAYSPLTLAFVGDGVYDLLVREYLARQGNRPVGELNRRKVALVKCESQASFAKALMPELSERELAVYKRGRNAAPKCTPKHGSVADYHSATGLGVSVRLSSSQRRKTADRGTVRCYFTDVIKIKQK